MGVYLSAPVTDKHSIDRSCKICTYGASSMQGWRLTQEDAHNCIPDYDSKEDSAFFAVYDGHGGAEVAQYCAMHLPDFIQTMPEYKEEKFEEALKVAFLKFDGTLTEEAVVRELRRLAGNQTEEEDPEVEKHEAEMLRAEADMPLEDLLGQYDQGVSPPSSKPRNRRQFLSPIIRTKRPIFPGEGSSAADPEDSSSPQEVKGSGSIKAEDSQGCQDINSSSSSTQEPDMGGDRLEDKLINGHADNDNNLNIEREIKGSMEEEATPTPDTSVGSSSSGEGQSRGDGGRAVERDSNADGACEVTDSTCIKQSRDSTVNETGDVSSTTDGNLGEVAESNRKDNGRDKLQEPQDGEAASSSSSKQKPDEETPTSAGSSKGKMKRQKASPDADGRVASSQSSSRVRQSFAEALDKDTLDDCEDDSDDSNWEDIPDDEDDDDDDEEEDEEEEAEDGDEDDEEGEYVEGEEYEEEEDDEDDDDDDDDATYMLGSEDGHMDMTSEEPGSGSGCTACVAMIVGRRLVVANAGDSRCVLCRNNQAVELSFDHKPEDEPEKSRIEKAGGKVTADGRVNGGLNLSRAIGDHVYKQNKELPDREQMITALPDIQSVTLTDADEFMVLACDGIWNFMTSEQVVQFVKERMQDPEKRKKLSKICEELFDHCLAPNTFGDGTGCDNMTCIIVDLKRTKADCNSLGDNKRAPDEEEDLPCSSAEKRRKIEDSQDASSSSQAACSSSTTSLS